MMPTFLLACGHASLNPCHMNTPHLHLDHGAIQALPSLLKTYGLTAPVLMLCDTRTYAVAGEAIEKQLGDMHGSTVNLGLNVKALQAHAHDVRAALAEAGSLLVVGSGTLNDIGKLAAFRENKPYAVFATAASMNGYASPTASLVKDDVKQSLPARAPALIVADMDVLANAPLRLSQAGLADTLCRPCVEADLLLAHTVLDTDYQPDIFAPLREHEHYLFEHSSQLPQQNAEYIKHLFEALVDGGNAMAAMGSSAPASQGEHMVAHTLEAMYPKQMEAHYHGEHIAVTSMSCLRIQHYLMQSPFTLSKAQLDTEALRNAFGEARANSYSKLAMAKRLSTEKAEAATEQLHKQWDRFRLRFQSLTVPPEQLEKTLHQAGIATDSESIGIPRHEYDQALLLAPYTRERFTFLDVAAMRREQRAA